MLKLILQGMIVLLLSLALGGVSIYAYNSLFGSKNIEKKELLLSLTQALREKGVVEEVYDDDGVLMDQLAYSFDDSEMRNTAFNELKTAGFGVRMVDDRIMIEKGKAGNALDLLMLKGFIPGAANFAFTDITAEKGTRDYNIQSQLASQNMLARIIATMSPEIQDVEVHFKSSADYKSINGVVVSVSRSPGVNGISVADIKGIKRNVAAFTDLDNMDSIELIDARTGREF